MHNTMENLSFDHLKNIFEFSGYLLASTVIENVKQHFTA